MKEKIYKILPNILQNFLISLFNKRAYKIRYGGKYNYYRDIFKKNKNLSLEELKNIQKDRYEQFINLAIKQSPYYHKILSKIKNVSDISYIKNLPIINKEEFRKHIKEIIANTSEQMEKSKTGGTTGKSLEVFFTATNSQERFAFLDDFRSRFGYELGKKTAWFSGKNLLTQKDIQIKRFWKTDFVNQVRYYSTFHIKQEYLKFYVEDLIKFKPEYLVGFPSTILDIAKYGLANGYDFPSGVIKAIFPTAETITEEMRNTIEAFFKTKMYNQYASSEGAPFIFECSAGNLHLELQSGVFEVLDDDNQPTNSGRLVITSFTTEGTPLIRYDIGDRITLEDSNKVCNCGNHNPLVKEILGRIDDFVYSPEIGKINLGNISNTLKDTKGIIQFQVIQNELNSLEIYVIKDEEVYNTAIEKKFLQNWRDRVGKDMNININYIKSIPVEKSGKFRIVKNNIKHLL